MQRAAPISVRNFFFGSACLRQRRFGGYGDEGIQRGVELVDAVEAIAGQFNRRNFLAAQAGGKVNNGVQSLHGLHIFQRHHCSRPRDGVLQGGSLPKNIVRQRKATTRQAL